MQSSLFEAPVYSNRRKRLAKTVRSGIILLMGNDESPMNFADNCFPFRQDSSFLYFTGIGLPGLAVIIDCETGEEILYGPQQGMDDIIWMGALPSLKDLAGMVNIHKTGSVDQLKSLLDKSQPQRTIHILHPYQPSNKIKLAFLLDTTVAGISHFISVPLIKAVVAQREIKEDIELEQIESAVNTSVAMHEAAMQYAKPGMKEYEVAAKVEEVALNANGRLSYPIILTINGQVLHNHYHGNELKEGDMILCDAGAENEMHYAGDLTRTFPVGKTFTLQQEEIYQVVLDSLHHAVKQLKPNVRFIDVHTEACIKLLEGLKMLNLVKGDPAEAVKAGAHTLFFQCGLGHMMGLDVHDMEDLGENYVGYTEALIKSKEFGWKSLRLGKELQPGFVLTVEPGIYIIPELIDRWESTKHLDSFINYKELAAWRNFGGVRIENNYVITATGYKMFGRPLAESIAEINIIRSAI
jgi:Xaa-Pro aminopeptidase